MTDALTFTVVGIAQPQGSMHAFTPRGWKHAIVTHAKPSLKIWRQLVADAAGRAIDDADLTLFADGVRLTIAFYLPRPKSLAKRATAHITAPDLDKLARAVADALTAIAYRDDAQICELVTAKHYAGVGEPAHVTIRVEATAGVEVVDVPAAPLPLFQVQP